jgi:hypothetical protein
MKKTPEQFFVKDDGIFPNNRLHILYYLKAIDLPKLSLLSRKKIIQTK